jgi:hypothetical protein
MNSTAIGDDAIQCRDQAHHYDNDTLLEFENEFGREFSEGKQHRPKRASSQKRRKSAKGSTPGCGISRRHNHRWTW